LEQLLILGEKLPAKGQEDVLFDRLNIRRQDHHGYAFRHKALAEELEDLQAKKMACQNEITFCNERLDFFSDQLQNEESISLHLGIIEKQKLIAEKERFLTQLEAETYALQQMIQKKMEGTNYTNVQEINELLDLIENQPAIERKKEELEQTMDAMSIELELSHAQLQVDFAIAELANLDITTIEAQLKDITGRLEITSMEVQHLERLLSEQEQLQQTYDEVLLRLQQQELIFQPYFAEMELVTVESGMAFRRRVQQRIADKLLSQTNGILEKISGRYYLRQGVSEQGLALEVEDTYQANVRRLPKTLSGGESFVVSLALALGLSELANNGRSVDSLFLDEGFGNLDADSLYTVISTLENLHTYGKTVGVISHVEAVQKRFKAQLQVVKKPNGMGELKKAS
jgi:exonuclease SbcC